MQAKIGAALMPKLKPESKPYEVHDTELKGFLLRVQPTGVISYYCTYRNKTRKRNRILLGRHPTISATKARDLARNALAGVVFGEDPAKAKAEQRSKKDHTLKSYIDDHYASWVTTNRKDGKGTIARLKAAFAGLINLPLEQIDSLVIDKWRNQRLKAGRAASTINRDITALKAAIAKAVEWGLIEQSPVSKVKPARVDSGRIVRYLSAEEETRLLNALDSREEKARAERERANQWRKARGYALMPDLRSTRFVDHLKPMVLLSLNTGLRQGELFNLHWTDIDIERANLTVHGDSAKSGKTRHIPLNSVAMQILNDWKNQQEATDGLVFPSTEGKPFDNVKHAWQKLLAEANITSFRWHDLRHHFASKLVMSGVDLNTVRELLGHADLKMTLRYAHLAPEHKAAAVEKLVKGREQ